MLPCAIAGLSHKNVDTRIVTPGVEWTTGEEPWDTAGVVVLSYDRRGRPPRRTGQCMTNLKLQVSHSLRI